MPELLHKALSYQIVGAAMEVHNVLGSGFLEKVYEEALSYELHLRGIHVETQRQLKVTYRGQLVGDYIADMVVEDKVIPSTHSGQALNSKRSDS